MRTTVSDKSHSASRAEIVRQILAATGTGPALVSIVGPTGIGRSTLLAELHEKLRERGTPILRIRYTPGPAGRSTCEESLFGNPRLPSAAEMRKRHDLVLLIDDAQWMDGDTVSALEALIRSVAGTGIRCISTTRLPMPPASEHGLRAFSRLREHGLAQAINLRPLPSREIAAIIANAVQARPDPMLVNELSRLTRGVPAALVATLDDYRQRDAIRVVDRHALLVPHRSEPCLPDNHELVMAVRGLGEQAWSVAKAMAVLHPLDAAVPELAATALDMPDEDILPVLDALRHEGVLVRRQQSWRFRVPLLAATLRTHLGPYERRRLAQLAVTALWAGTARSSDPHYLADQLANAGRLVDPTRACAELIAHADAAPPEQGHRAERWLYAAADLTIDRLRRADILLKYAITCFAHGCHHRSLESTNALLLNFPAQLPPDLRQEIQILHVVTRHAVNDMVTHEKIVSGEWWPWPSEPAQQILTRASGMLMRDQWQQVRELLAATREIWQAGTPGPNEVGRLYESLAALWQGEPKAFREDSLAEPDRPEPHPSPPQQVAAKVGAWLVLGERDDAERLLRAKRMPEERMPPAAQALLATQRGEYDRALDLTRRHIVNGGCSGFDPSQVAMYQSAALILIIRARLSRARELLGEALSARPVLRHILIATDILIDRTVGDTDRAERRLVEGLRIADELGVLVDTDVLWARRAELAIARGDLDTARKFQAAVERVAAVMETGRATVFSLALHAIIERDRNAAEDAIWLARKRNQPLELAYTLTTLIEHGVGDPALLPEVYELLGEKDALLYREWLRGVMRAHQVTVPGRQATVMEQERLLAVLVAEGLGNKQLAIIMRTSEKSVEGRLSRLFSRTGYRTRVELATAALAGEFDRER